MESKMFELHRKNVLSQMEDNSVMIIFSREKEEAIVNQKYNVNRNYYYICGVLEYGNVVILSKNNGVEGSTIFINPYDEFKAKWVGAPLSKEEVSNISGIKEVRYLDSFDQYLGYVLESTKNVYLDIEPSDLKSQLTLDEEFAKNIKEKKPWLNILNARDLFRNARTVKDEDEISLMKKAISITNEGIKNILKNLKESYEYQIESYFDQAIKYYGSTGFAFPTIAASGKNACCLHYGDNNCIAKDGDLILFDLGASVNMYCADISRTFPVSGKFTERQKQIYNIVLAGQELVFKHARPGITTRELNKVLVDFYGEELMKIGLINNPSEVSKYYYHGVSHHIGLDCHDLCDYGPLKPGCVISNEPGLYIAEEGIGIRIEDDVLITENGAEWLSPQIIKTVEEIEEFMKN
ncbi:MAG: M24 family metallopeptidase [Erysipelotrichaceae bacterium]|nr:M24 family metallopeptidase [Erysipelotrichaceae bacterium]